ncbi:MAG: Flp family type IVb pilin [Sneathiella sp.]|uniref:Flp family type IVb pilin n=1 Tax=Sneathiella sp. TaxID=1964365 RepID=UPI000C5686CB|nr:Flp family type IVb pilin [Sneathiella sp.]MAZ03740.1 Flp family type IVb pilin [Sneathiella sp.]|tara:strand:- start:757 stop:981 length:225 start_codon:yes stop_codon:yes gene_type:complete
MIKVIRSFVTDESGATAIEYGLIAALVALVGVVAFTAVGDTIFDAFDEIAKQLCEGADGTYTASTSDTAGSCAI